MLGYNRFKIDRKDAQILSHKCFKFGANERRLNLFSGFAGICRRFAVTLLILFLILRPFALS